MDRPGPAPQGLSALTSRVAAHPGIALAVIVALVIALGYLLWQRRTEAAEGGETPRTPARKKKDGGDASDPETAALIASINGS